MKRNFTLLSVFCLFALLLTAQPKAGYYDDAIGTSDEGLRTALFNIIKDHTELSYSGLWTAFYDTDATADGKVWDMYSDIPGGTPPYIYSFGTNQCGNYSGEGDCYNREHSLPKSWFGGDVFPMYTDLFHLYPTDGYVNGMRGNYPFGEVGSVNWTSKNGSKRGTSSSTGYSGIVFEPIDAYKGDFARTYFYMSTRYKDRNLGQESTSMFTGSELDSWAVNVLLKWHREDPVSLKETDRNNAVEEYQHNRNPFIDYPELAEYIWGNKKGEVWGETTGSGQIQMKVNILQNPVQNEIHLHTQESDINYYIITVSGQIIKSGVIPDSKIISVPELNNGLYLLRLQAGNAQAIQKIIVDK